VLRTPAKSSLENSVCFADGRVSISAMSVEQPVAACASPAPTRREFLRAGCVAVAVAGAFGALADGFVPPPSEVPPGGRPPRPSTVEVLHPRGRVPLSFIIDDSTCLVNMGRFCMPQFKAAWPQNPVYRKPWKDWPAEIPDAFLREFGEFCAAEGVRGKFSLVPYPACVGWLDRELPGWTRSELRDSLKLVRELMVPNWDITPEMVTHTHVIDLKTGRPLDPPGPATMENSYPPQKQSADELAAYIAYALKLLKNCDIPCTGVTTPGGFGNSDRSALSLAMRQALTDVFGLEIPFYFKYIAEAQDGTQPRLEHVEPAGPAGEPKLVVDVPAGTGDWFGNWDGDQPPTGEKYCNEDATAGRMVELIERGEPAVMFGHWAGFYSNGSRRGFEACRKVVTALNRRFADRTVWMKTSELARYWAARELTRIEHAGGRVTLSAPLAAPAFTLRVAGATAAQPTLTRDGTSLPLQEVSAPAELAPGTWQRREKDAVVCFDLRKGSTVLAV
jgi:hypothetical protein